MTSSVLWGTADKVLALVGLLIVVAEIYVLAISPIHALVLALGVLLIYLGTWRTTGKLLHRRANMVLRGELDQFISLVRKLYGSRTKADSAGIHEAKAELRESLERIISAANTYQESA